MNDGSSGGTAVYGAIIADDLLRYLAGKRSPHRENDVSISSHILAASNRRFLTHPFVVLVLVAGKLF